MNNNFQLLKMFRAVLYAQQCAIHKEIIVILITLLFPLMQSTDPRLFARSLSMRFLLVDHAIHLPPPEVFKERDIWWSRRLGLWTKTSTRYEGIVFAREGSNKEGGSLKLTNTIVCNIMWSVLRQGHSTFQKEFSSECEITFSSFNFHHPFISFRSSNSCFSLIVVFSSLLPFLLSLSK